MRSVFLFYEKQNEKDLFKLLDSYCEQSFKYADQCTQWNKLKNNDGMFYIYPTSVDELFDEMEDKSDFDKINTMNKPLAALIVDISGRHDGAPEIKELSTLLLSKINGYMQDDYTYHFWTIEEIKNDVLISGHPFFDYKGWYEEYQKAKM